MVRPKIPFEIDEPDETSKYLLPEKTEGVFYENKHLSPELEKESTLTVSQLTRKIRLILESRFRGLVVEGELSNFHCAPSGHWYFTLKDEESQIRGLMFRQNTVAVRFQPEDGLQVTLRGHLSVYSPRGEYQFHASAMEPQGIGALQLAFEQLKKRLQAEGLFDQTHKKPIPVLPRCIGLITSPSGAAVHDLLSVLKRRFPGLPVILFPALVQGEHAQEELNEGIRALNHIQQQNNIDVIILGRGGGSLEDLWAFNDEQLARSIHTSEIPVISAVGHETDFTISDFVSDLRAPTPSAAMELAVPDKGELQEALGIKIRSLKRIIAEYTNSNHERVDSLRSCLASPRQAIEQHIQKADSLHGLLKERFRTTMSQKRNTTVSMRQRLISLNPQRQLGIHLRNVSLLCTRLPASIQNLFQHRRERFHSNASLLESLSPLAVLHRGFSLNQKEDGSLLRSVEEVKQGDNVEIRLEDGKLKTRVLEKTKNLMS